MAEKAVQIKSIRTVAHITPRFLVLPLKPIRKRRTAKNRQSPNEGIYILRSLNKWVRGMNEFVGAMVRGNHKTQNVKTELFT